MGEKKKQCHWVTRTSKKFLKGREYSELDCLSKPQPHAWLGGHHHTVENDKGLGVLKLQRERRAGMESDNLMNWEAAARTARTAGPYPTDTEQPTTNAPSPALLSSSVQLFNSPQGQPTASNTGRKTGIRKLKDEPQRKSRLSFYSTSQNGDIKSIERIPKERELAEHIEEIIRHPWEDLRGNSI